MAELWTSAVEARLDASLGEPSSPSPRPSNDKIIALFFDRYSPKFDQAILTSPLALDLIQQGHDVQPRWADGAKVLVHDFQPGDAEEARVILHGRMARQYVFVRSSNVELILSAVQQVTPWQQRPVLKANHGRQAVPSDGNSSWFMCSALVSFRPACFLHCPVRRTFIHYEVHELPPRRPNTV